MQFNITSVEQLQKKACLTKDKLKENNFYAARALTSVSFCFVKLLAFSDLFLKKCSDSSITF